MQVRDVMTANVERVPPETSLSEAAAKMKQCDVGAIPVYDGDRLIGVVTDRDITIRAVAEGRDSAVTPVRDVMSPGIAYCFDDQDIREAGALMRQKKLRRLVVLNRDKRLVGIVSLGDLAAQGDDKVAGKTLKGVARDGRQSARRTSTKRDQAPSPRAAQTR